jgi:hypothetical protein
MKHKPLSTPPIPPRRPRKPGQHKLSHRWVDLIEDLFKRSEAMEKEADRLKSKAGVLRAKAMDLMAQTHPPANPYTVVFNGEAYMVATSHPQP